MSWDAYKLALLREMGLTAWVRRDGGPTAEEADVQVRPAPAPAQDQAVAAPDAPWLPEPSPAAAVGVQGRRAGGVASMDWAALRDAVASCTACKLCQGRRQTVFGVGAERAEWMIVGEAPGEQEDLKGEPFVGPAGKLLDQMLHAIGLAREPGAPRGQVYIANVLKCRPPHNRNPEPEEIAQCEPFLRRQIELVQPRIILAMGRFAVQTLLQSQEAIGRLRGRVHRYQGIPVVVTYHPAYLLRNLPDKAKAWEDLCLAVHQLRQERRATEV
ncbi:MAG: uracil-DNA glycosylase [Pseudomonadota bacterium]